MSATRHLVSLSLIVALAIVGAALFPAGVAAKDSPAATDLGNIELPVNLPDPAAPAARDRFVDLFSPFRTERAALSPDGKLLAYTVREQDELFVHVVAIDAPQALTARIKVLSDRLATPMMRIRTSEATPAQIRWMSWVKPTRLVFETNRNHAFGDGNSWRNANGEIVAIDADGQNALTLANPRILSRPSTPASTGVMPDDEPAEGDTDEAADAPSVATTSSFIPASVTVLGLHPTDDNLILVRTRGSVFNVFEIDVTTGKRRLRSQEISMPDSISLVDREGRIRVSMSRSAQERFPRPFRHELGRARAEPLDEIAATVGGFSLSPGNFFGQRSIPVGFDDNADLLYFASNVGRDTYGIYALNVKSGQKTGAAIESRAIDFYQPEPGEFAEPASFGLGPEVDPASPSDDMGSSRDTDPVFHGGSLLVIDRFERKLAGIRYSGRTRTAVWTYPDIQAVQSWLDRSFPGSSAEILEWDQARKRFLILARHVTDPGSFQIFDLERQQLAEYVRRSPPLDEAPTTTSVTFSVDRPDGVRLNGVLVLPRTPKVQPVPLAVMCPTVPWARVGTDYSREFHALASMGLAAVEFNGRGAWGHGIKQRAAIRNGFEEAQADDIIALIDALASKYPVSTTRVALIGRGHGGFVALRCLQLHPERFRCAVTLDALVDPGSWISTSSRDETSFGTVLLQEMFGDRERLRAAPLLKETDHIIKPVLALSFRGLDNASAQHASFLANSRLVRSLRARGVAAELMELDLNHATGLPRAVASEWQRIEAFLNAELYDYRVKLGTTEVLETSGGEKEPPKP